MKRKLKPEEIKLITYIIKDTLEGPAICVFTGLFFGKVPVFILLLEIVFSKILGGIVDFIAKCDYQSFL
jgi:hypothetical protein